jgi:hypothetical protein
MTWQQMGSAFGAAVGWTSLRKHLADTFSVPYDDVIREIAWGPEADELGDAYKMHLAETRVDILGPFEVGTSVGDSLTGADSVAAGSTPAMSAI